MKDLVIPELTSRVRFFPVSVPIEALSATEPHVQNHPRERQGLQAPASPTRLSLWSALRGCGPATSPGQRLYVATVFQGLGAVSGSVWLLSEGYWASALPVRRHPLQPLGFRPGVGTAVGEVSSGTVATTWENFSGSNLIAMTIR